MKDITSTITKPLAVLGENRRHGFRCQRNARRERKAYAGGACKGSDCKRSNGFAGSRCCLIANTTPKGATPSDPFWEKAG